MQTHPDRQRQTDRWMDSNVYTYIYVCTTVAEIDIQFCVSLLMLCYCSPHIILYAVIIIYKNSNNNDNNNFHHLLKEKNHEWPLYMFFTTLHCTALQCTCRENFRQRANNWINSTRNVENPIISFSMFFFLLFFQIAYSLVLLVVCFISKLNSFHFFSSLLPPEMRIWAIFQIIVIISYQNFSISCNSLKIFHFVSDPT